MTRQIVGFMWNICKNCTVRNCHKKPKIYTAGFYCNKRRGYRGGFKLQEVARFRDMGYSKGIVLKGGI